MRVPLLASRCSLPQTLRSPRPFPLRRLHYHYVCYSDAFGANAVLEEGPSTSISAAQRSSSSSKDSSERQQQWQQLRLARVRRAQVKIHRRAKAAQRQGRRDSALAILYAGLASYPNDTHMMCLAVSLELKEGNLVAAEELLARGLEQHPRNLALLSTAARMHAAAGRYDEARELFAAAHKAKPQEAPVLQVGPLQRCAHANICVACMAAADACLHALVCMSTSGVGVHGDKTLPKLHGCLSKNGCLSNNSCHPKLHGCLSNNGCLQQQLVPPCMITPSCFMHPQKALHMAHPQTRTPTKLHSQMAHQLYNPPIYHITCALHTPP